MFILAESGSTKIDWRIIQPGEPAIVFTTEGFNPNYHASHLLAGYLGVLAANQKIEDAGIIYFYGSGCSSDHSRAIVKTAIHQVLPSAKVEVWHDLFGAARALFGNGSGIASILGTGSSSCLFKEGNIVDSVPSLGFLLADEGSGFQLGQLLINAFFKNELPKSLADKFKNQYQIELVSFLTKLYSHPKPNTMLASFVPFMVENKDEPAIQQLVKKAFVTFFDEIILKYSECKAYELGFVGSIAFLFSDILMETAIQRGLRITRIIQNPVDELVKYHLAE
jgi:N-acetylglucosamine kinase-like BadF-type ATPase